MVTWLVRGRLVSTIRRASVVFDRTVAPDSHSGVWESDLSKLARVATGDTSWASVRLGPDEEMRGLDGCTRLLPGTGDHPFIEVSGGLNRAGQEGTVLKGSYPSSPVVQLVSLASLPSPRHGSEVDYEPAGAWPSASP